MPKVGAVSTTGRSGRRILLGPLVGALLLAPSAPTPAAAQGYSVEDILAAPFATDLVASPSGAAFAWVRYDRGSRNIWVAEGPEFVGRELTDWTEDDGQDLSQLSFTPDGGTVVFVRGGGPNRAGEIPNPASEPDPQTRMIWAVSLAGSSRALAEGASPAVSPDGSVAAFLRQGQIFVVSLEGEPEVAPLLNIRGSAGSLTWSAGGDRLAFVSNRGDHAFVGVFALADRSLRYLDPSLDRDGSPVWSPDGTHLGFIRIPNERSQLPFAPRRSAEPWSVRIADVASGEGREVWRAAPGRGSAFHGVSGPQLLWTASGELVFPWEREGWTHLYAVPQGGGAAVPLTMGEFEVEHVAAGPDGRSVYYSSNTGDIDRRHLWRVAPGENPVALTSGGGIEWSPAVAADGTLAYLASDASTPAHAEVARDGTGRRAMVSGFLPQSFPRSDLVEPRGVTFASEDGLVIHGQLFVPTADDGGARRPAAIFFHGGSRRQMLLGWHYMRYYHNTYALNQYLASRGYVVLSVNYRSGTGYGLDFREALDYGAQGASEYRDVVAAGRFLAERDDVDPSRIALWGGSYGGYLTALGLARDSDMFAAGVDLHGVHDWNVVIENFVPSYDPASHPEFARLASQSSPMAWLDGWRSPVLLIHGDDDRNVPFSESVGLVEELRERGVDVEQLVFPDEVHGFLLHRSWRAAFEHAASFLDDRLGRVAAAGGAEER